jgi:O-antigen/teichoic acid export membrane protein
VARLSNALPDSIAKLGSHKLVTNASVYVLASMLQKAMAFFLIPLYTRFLTPEDYGIVGLALATSGVLTAFLGFGIYGSVARYYYEYRNHPEHLKQYLTTNFLFLIVGAGSVTLLLDVWGEPLWSSITSGNVPFSPYIRIILWSSYASILFQVPLALFRTQQKAGSYAASQMAYFVINLGMVLLLVVVWRMGALGQLTGMLVASVSTTVVVCALSLWKWFTPKLSWTYLRASLLFGLPLVPHLLSGWAMGFADRLLLEPRIPLEELGRYNLGYQVGLAMSVLVTSINMAWSPYYYDLMERNADPEKRIRQVTGLYVAVIGGLCLLGALFGQEFLRVLAPPQYHSAALYVPLILFSYLLNGFYYFASMPLFYYKKTSLIPVVTIVSALSNVGFNLWLIPKWGALGSAWATVLSYLVLLCLAYFLGRRWQKIRYPLAQYGMASGLILVGAVLSTYLQGSEQLSQLTWKLAIAAMFTAIAYAWLIKPNLAAFGFQKSLS